VRFFLDQNVPASVRTMLQEEGHDCWTASQAGLANEGQDDNLTVYATDQRAALISMDREFSQRRLENPYGHHIWLHCAEPKAAKVLQRYLPEVLRLLHREHVTIEVREDSVRPKSRSD
jgi:predicted nuclease of predicted toxin-antitoxin system